MLGEGVPSSFYSTIDERSVISGLIPRFTIIEYNGPRVPENKFHAQAKPTEYLLQRMSDLASICLGRIAHKQVCNVGMTPEVYQLDDEFNNWCDTRINGTAREVIKALWSRARVKVLKLAALLSVGNNYIEPIIDVDSYNWAKSVIVYETENLSKKFIAGKIIGDNDNLENEQVIAVLRLLDKWLNSSYAAHRGIRTTPEMHKDGIFILSDIQMRCNQLAVFKRDTRNDMARKMGRAIETIKSAGLFTEVNWGLPEFTAFRCRARAIKLADYNLVLEYLKGAE